MREYLKALFAERKVVRRTLMLWGAGLTTYAVLEFFADDGREARGIADEFAVVLGREPGRHHTEHRRHPERQDQHRCEDFDECEAGIARRSTRNGMHALVGAACASIRDVITAHGANAPSRLQPERERHPACPRALANRSRVRSPS